VAVEESSASAAGAVSPRRAWWVTAAAGAAVIAVCYGVARYAYGLFAPRITSTFGLDTVGIGVLGGLATAGYGLGLLVAPPASTRSARGAVLAAGAAAGLGLALMALSPNVVVFGAGMVVAGGSAGLVSPGVAQLVGETVERRVQARAQTWANTGTSLGLALSAFTPLLVTGWRPVWAGFALVAAVVTVVACWMLPSRSRPGRRPQVSSAPSRPSAPVTPLVLNSVLLGVTSAPYWTFSNARLGEAGLGPTATTWCWFAIGVAGLVGGTAGRAAGRFGLRPTNLAVWTLWSAGIALLALPAPGVVASLVSAAVFGAGFMALTGLCIVWAARLFPARPAHGVTLSFLGFGVGQTAGTPSAGALADWIGLGPVFAVTGLLGLLAWTQCAARLAPPGGTRPAERSPCPAATK